MEVKKSKRPSFSLWLIPARFGFGIGLWYLTAFFLVPLIGEIIPSVHEYFDILNEPENYQELRIVDTFIQGICSFIGFFPATAISLILSRKSRTEFVENTKCLVGYKEGIRYHITKYWTADMVFLAVLYAFLYIPSLFNMRNMMRYVPLTAALCGYFGFFFGLILFVIVGYAVSLFGAFAAQRKWRADYLSE